MSSRTQAERSEATRGALIERRAPRCSPSAATPRSGPRRSCAPPGSPAAPSITTSTASATCCGPSTSSSRRRSRPRSPRASTPGASIARDARGRRPDVPRPLPRARGAADRPPRRPGGARLGGVAGDRRALRARADRGPADRRDGVRRDPPPAGRAARRTPCWGRSTRSRCWSRAPTTRPCPRRGRADARGSAQRSERGTTSTGQAAACISSEVTLPSSAWRTGP